MLNESGLIRNTTPGTSYVDLGEVPTPAEERTAQHMQVDEPPPPEDHHTGTSPGRPNRQATSASTVARQEPREEPGVEQTPDIDDDTTSSPSAS